MDNLNTKKVECYFKKKKKGEPIDVIPRTAKPLFTF